MNRYISVAPPVGAWIEIIRLTVEVTQNWVAPPVGAWIEIKSDSRKIVQGLGRSPCGSVD